MKNNNNDEEVLDPLEDQDNTEEDFVPELTGEMLDEEDLVISEPDEDSDEDPEEIERRRVAYLDLKKNDKIFNNSFNLGYPPGEEIDDHRGHSEIKLDVSSPDYHLYNRDQHSAYLDDSITQFDIHQVVSESPEIRAILGDNPEKKKFTKIEINDLFELIVKGVARGNKSSVFGSSIHILDSISSLTGLEFKKLFDMLTYENKEILLLELDKTYHFLDKASKESRVYE